MPEKATPPQKSTQVTELKSDAAYRDEIKKLKADIGRLQSDVSELVNLLKGSATEKGSDIKDKVGKEAERIFEELMAKVDEGVSRGRHTVDEVSEHIGEHPVGSLFITFTLGYILAKIIDRGGNSGKSD